MKLGTSPSAFGRAILSIVLVVALSFASPKQAQAQNGGTYVNGDLGSFVSFVCGNLPTTNLAQVLQDILNQLSSLRLSMNGLGVNGGIVGDPSVCLPGFNANLQLPGLPDLSGCFNFQGIGNIGANIGNCLSGVLGQFQDLSQYFAQFNWNYNDLLACLQGLVQIPTITIPDFLANLRAVLDNIIALLNSLSINFNTYNGFYNFFIDFCQNHYNANGYANGGGSSGGSFSNTVSVNGDSVVMSAAPLGGPGGAVSMPSGAVAVLKPSRGKAKQRKMSCNSTVCKATFKKVGRGTYKTQIQVLDTANVPTTISNSTVTVR